MTLSHWTHELLDCIVFSAQDSSDEYLYLVMIKFCPWFLTFYLIFTHPSLSLCIPWPLAKRTRILILECACGDVFFLNYFHLLFFAWPNSAVLSQVHIIINTA